MTVFSLLLSIALEMSSCSINIVEWMNKEINKVFNLPEPQFSPLYKGGWLCLHHRVHLG